MLTEFQELISILKGGEEEGGEELSILEQLEQENSNNVTERHQLIAEREYEQSGKLAHYGKQMSGAILVNSAITYGLLLSIDGLTLNFNPILFYLLTGGVNTATSVLTLDKEKRPFTNILLGSSKFVINMSINGQLINQMHTKVNESRVVVQSIRSEIENYESGYKQTNNNYSWVLICVVLAILIFILPKIIVGNRES